MYIIKRFQIGKTKGRWGWGQLFVKIVTTQLNILMTKRSQLCMLSVMIAAEIKKSNEHNKSVGIKLPTLFIWLFSHTLLFLLKIRAGQLEAYSVVLMLFARSSLRADTRRSVAVFSSL
jgi:hypothetical protein